MTRDDIIEILNSFEWDIQHYDTNKKIRAKYDGEIDNLWGAIADEILGRFSAPITHIRISKGVARYVDGFGEYLKLPDKKDWKFGKKDFTIEAYYRWTRWDRIKTWLRIMDYKYIIHTKWWILTKLKLCKVSFGEYLDILSFRK